MTVEEFKKSLTDEKPAQDITDLLKALWYEAKGDWDKAHSIAQDISTKEGSLLHAYLHRVEGDEWNAGYWYNRAGENPHKGSLREEWEFLLKKFL